MSYEKDTEKSILNLVKSSQIWIVIRLICCQTEFRLMLNVSKKCDYYPNVVRFNEIEKIISLLYRIVEIKMLQIFNLNYEKLHIIYTL